MARRCRYSSIENNEPDDWSHKLIDYKRTFRDEYPASPSDYHFPNWSPPPPSQPLADVDDPFSSLEFGFAKRYHRHRHHNHHHHHHHEFYDEPSRSRFAKKNRMANVVPWLMTMSLLSLQEFPMAEFAELKSDVSQELEAPSMLPELPSMDFVMPSTTSFDDPAFGQEEPPAAHNCDFPRNHKHDNAIRQPKQQQQQQQQQKQQPQPQQQQQQSTTDKPHGFLIDPNFVTMQTKQPENKKNERNVDSYHSIANSNTILPTNSKSNSNNNNNHHHYNNHQQPQQQQQQQPNRLNQSERYFTPGHNFKPPKETGFKDEFAGPAMQLAYSWKTVDFEFENEEHKNSLLYSGTFIPENNLPLGLEVWKDKIFVSLPRWKKGIPVTLATISTKSLSKSPKLRPYPNWRWHHLGNCQLMTSVFRMQIDECDRLWVLDSGKIDVTNEPKQICPPKIFVFDLHTDELIRSYALPADQIKEDSLYTNIVVDVRNEQCDRAVAYASDVWRFGLIVYDLFNDSSFRVQHHYFYPDPLHSRYNLHGLEFHWTDGLFGIALTPVDINDEKTMFFHPMSSFREFAVPLSALRDKRTADTSPDKFVPVGKPRAKDYGHASGSAIDRNGVMFFNMVTRDSVWCWDTRKEYIPQNLGVIGASNVSLVFPNDVRMDHEEDQNVWVLSNKLPMYLYGYWNKNEVNFRIMKANAKEAIRNTVCDPTYIVPENAPVYDNSAC